MRTPPHADKLVTPAMVVLGLVLATLPLWISRVGLYPYLGVEILIWSLYALAFNLLLGTAGLPSFGMARFSGSGPTPSACPSSMSRPTLAVPRGRG
jgi:branched-chain amino acid transport system permease protein